MSSYPVAYAARGVKPLPTFSEKLSATPSSTPAKNDSKKELSAAHHYGPAVVGGFCESFFRLPCSAIKTAVIEKLPLMRGGIKGLYRGLGPNMAVLMFQRGAVNGLWDQLKENQVTFPVALGVTTGAEFLIASTCEVITTKQQASNKSFSQVVKELVKKGDARVLLQGGFPMLARNITFNLVFFGSNSVFREQCNLSATPAAFLSGQSAVVASQFFDTLKNLMQARNLTAQSAFNVMQKEGFCTGLKWRMLAVGGGSAIARAVKDSLTPAPSEK